MKGTIRSFVVATLLGLSFALTSGGCGGSSQAPGSKIVFVSNRDRFAEIIIDTYAMSADGTVHASLTNNVGDNTAPFGSPEGTKIAFVSVRDGNWEICVANADGTGQVNLTNNPGIDWAPLWRTLTGPVRSG